MRDETLIEPFAVPEIFVDGFTEHMIHNGVMSCVGFRLQPPSHQHGDMQKVVVVRLVWPVGATEEAIAETKRAQSAPFLTKICDRVGRH